MKTRSAAAVAAVERVVERMPLVRGLVANLSASGFRFDQNVALLGVQHIMAQSLALCWALNELGLGFDRIALCGKVYSTCFSSVEALESLGVSIQPPGEYRADIAHSQQLVRDVEELGRSFTARWRGRGTPFVLILDDGGQALTHLSQILPSGLAGAGVEQTASGFWQTGIRSVRIPIVDAGSSAVKRLCEPPIVIDAVERRVRRHLERYASGQVVGLVGLGFIGRHLAHVLRDEGYRLVVYDRRQTAHQGFQRSAAKNIEEVIERSDVIFGCTGNDITRELALGNGLRNLSSKRREFISISSGDDEFFSLKIALLGDGGGPLSYSIGAIPDVVGEIAGSEYSVARNGFPINFDNGEESAPLEYIQGTICALIAALAQGYLLRINAVGAAPDRVMLDLAFQSWLLRHWRNALPFYLKAKRRPLSPAPRQSFLHQLSTSRTSLESVSALPVFKDWTAT
ncbi:MAG: hypothetical protein QOG84_640 [Sphingomonadales bacterium]|nr:hypothetical protein [Sphingomonadales bacterium]